MAPQLTADHIRYGSVSALAQLLGVKTSQLSSWFNTDRQISAQNLERISRRTGITALEVSEAIAERRQALALVKKLNQEIRDKNAKAQA